MKRVVVVTVTYNTGKDTDLFLQSMENVKRTNLAVEIIIVDNASKETYHLPKGKREIPTTLIHSSINTGFTGGYNIGMEEALKHKSDYIMIVNNDTIVDPNMLLELITVLESNPTIGLVAPKIYFAKGHEFHKDRYRKEELGKVFWYAGGSTDWAHVQTKHRGVDEVDHGQYDTVEPTGFATGCCMMFPREVLEKVGLFDNRYFLYYEDADLNQRIKQAGYTIYYAPQAVLYHVNASSTGGAGSLLQDYFITRNRMLFGITYAPLRTKLALLRESLRLLRSGRPFQKIAIRDYYLGRFNKGTFFDRQKRSA